MMLVFLILNCTGQELLVVSAFNGTTKHGTALNDVPLKRKLSSLNEFPRIGKFRGNCLGVQHECSRQGCVFYSSHQDACRIKSKRENTLMAVPMNWQD